MGDRRMRLWVPIQLADWSFALAAAAPVAFASSGQQPQMKAITAAVIATAEHAGTGVFLV
jgi:hypothetical protein